MGLAGTAPGGGGRLISRFALARALARNWGLVFLRGIIGVLFGLLALLNPGLTLLSLIFAWGLYAIADGAFSLWAAISGKVEEGVSRWWLALIGICGIVAGIITLGWPGITTLFMLIAIALWAIITGGLQLVGAIALRKEIEGEWLLGLGGVLSIVLGIGLLAQPGAGALAMVWWIGALALLFGISQIVLSLRLRKFTA